METLQGSEGGIENAGATLSLGTIVIADCVCKSVFGGEGILGNEAEKFSRE